MNVMNQNQNDLFKQDHHIFQGQHFDHLSQWELHNQMCGLEESFVNENCTTMYVLFKNVVSIPEQEYQNKL